EDQGGDADQRQHDTDPVDDTVGHDLVEIILSSEPEKLGHAILAAPYRTKMAGRVPRGKRREFKKNFSLLDCRNAALAERRVGHGIQTLHGDRLAAADAGSEGAGGDAVQRRIDGCKLLLPRLAEFFENLVIVALYSPVV